MLNEPEIVSFTFYKHYKTKGFHNDFKCACALCRFVRCLLPECLKFKLEVGVCLKQHLHTSNKQNSFIAGNTLVFNNIQNCDLRKRFLKI